MTIVEMRQKRPVRSAEILAVQAQRVVVEVVFEAHQRGLPVHVVDHGSGECPVEPVNRAVWQRLWAADACRRNQRQTAFVDGLDLRCGELMLPDLQADVVQQWVRKWKLR